MSKVGYKLLKNSPNQRKTVHPCCRIALANLVLPWFGEGATPIEGYSKPKCTALVLPKKHFDPLGVKPAAFSFRSTR